MKEVEKMKRQNLESVLKEMKKNTRSAWERGVCDYALMLLDNRSDLEDFHTNGLKEELLNGASDWSQYIYGVYGRLKQNSREEWLDVQALALFQAYNLIVIVVKAWDSK